jgi:hypothetical protein
MPYQYFIATSSFLLSLSLSPLFCYFPLLDFRSFFSSHFLSVQTRRFIRHFRLFRSNGAHFGLSWSGICFPLLFRGSSSFILTCFDSKSKSLTSHRHDRPRPSKTQSEQMPTDWRSWGWWWCFWYRTRFTHRTIQMSLKRPKKSHLFGE